MGFCKNRAFSAVIFLFLAVFPAFSQETEVSASGKTEQTVMSLSQIDDLIEKKEYSKALEQLSLYIKIHPEQFDKSQKRISRILNARDGFNTLAKELSGKMQQSENLDESSAALADELDTQKMDIIVTLEKSEQNPPPEIVALTNDARRTVRLSYYINRSNLIISQGVAMINGARDNEADPYSSAAEKFKEALSLKTNDSDVVFEGEKEIPVVYPESLNAEVQRHIRLVDRYSQSLKLQLDDAQKAYDAYVMSLRNFNRASSAQNLTLVNDTFAALANTRNQIYREGLELKKLDQRALSLNPGLGDTSYITFSCWAVTGTGVDADSGIVGAVDSFWNTRVESMKQVVYDTIKANYEQIAGAFDIKSQTSFPASDYALINRSRTDSAEYADQGLKVQALYKLVESSPAQNFTRYNDSMNFAAAYSRNELRSLFATDSEIQNQNNLVDNYNPQNQDVTQTAKVLQGYIQNYNRQIQPLNALESSALVAGKKGSGSQPAVPVLNNRRTTSGVQLEDRELFFDDSIAFFEGAVKVSRQECERRAGLLWGMIAKNYSEQADKVLADFTLRNVHAKTLLDGVEESVSAGSETSTAKIVKFYPSQARTEAEKLNSDIQKEKTVLVSYNKSLSAGRQYNETVPEYANGVKNIETVISALDALIVQNNQIVATARQKIQLASKDANEARLNYQRAVAALNKNQFDEARNLLDLARRKYNSSLAQQEDASLRSESDRQLFSLDEEISRKQNEYVVRETRSLKESARTAYYNGNFDAAESNLVKARTLWAVTNVEEDQEITNLLALVNTALSMKTGRVIASTDPLYPEMSQILSISNQYYDQGAKLMADGKREEAKAILEQARAKLRTLQLIYPLNQDASLLILKIDRLVDPDAFNAMFEQKIQAARVEYKNPAKQNQAYADLLDLQQINPNYKGLASLILNIEYELGIKQKPVDNSSKTRSQNLTEQARKLYNSANGNENSLKRAVALLDQAISLNPNNSAATTLKDRIQTSIGGKATEILSAQDEQSYQLAVQEMNRGNIINANNLVEDLIAKNGQNKKLRQLRQRIRALM